METKANSGIALCALLATAWPCGCRSPAGRDAGSDAGGGGAQAQEALFAPPPDVAAVPPDAARTPSGLAWKRIRQGTGAVRPRGEDAVRVHYNGWTSGGKLVDSSFKKGRASIFILDDLIAGLSEGIQLMSAGDTMRFWIPPALAQGEAAAGGPLVYQVELLAVIRAPDPPPPAELAAPPKDAVKSTSGLAWKVLRFGEGFARPGTESIVALRFSGWTAADGKWRDTNFARPIPSVFPVKDLVAGWAEGIVLMTPGEKRRFWIPGELAYKGQAGKPQGMVVYDLELVEIRQQQAPAR